MPVVRREFGSTGLKVSAIGLGCARIGGIFQGDAEGFVRMLSVARDRGINFFDTADIYSQGESEALLGRAFRTARSSVVIASKVGYVLPRRRMFVARLKPFVRPVLRLLRARRDAIPAAARGALSQDFSPRHVRVAVEGSLRRLRTDYLDLLQLHSPPADVVERGEWVPVLEELKRAGKIRHYGISADTHEACVAALAFSGVSAVQFLLNVLEPGALERVLPEARSKRVATIARECLANGLLVKPEGEVDLDRYCSSPAERERRERQLTEQRGRARTAGVTLQRLALDYVTGQDGISVALVGARSVDQLAALLDQTSTMTKAS